MSENIAGNISPNEIISAARKRAMLHALKLPESLVIIALTVLTVTLSALGVFGDVLPPASAPMWLAFGIFAEGLIMAATLRDGELRRTLTRALFYERIDSALLVTPELQRSVAEALEYHRQVFRAIVARPNAPLGQVAHAMDNWVTGVFDVARRLDMFVNEPRVIERLQQYCQIAPRDAVRDMQDASASGIELTPHTQGRRPGAAPDEGNVLVNVRVALLGARDELIDSLDGMGEMHRAILATDPGAFDLEHAQGLHVQICDHMMRLESAGALVQTLFRRYSSKPGRHSNAAQESMGSVKAAVWQPQ